MSEITPGLHGELTLTVTEDQTAKHLGSGGVNVFATPAMIALMERTSLSVIDPLLDLTSLSYLGGGDEQAYAMGIDGGGNVFVTGETSSSVAYGVPGYDTTYNSGTDAFLAKFDNDLTSLLAFTYLGGTGLDCGYGVAFDAGGNVFLALPGG